MRVLGPSTRGQCEWYPGFVGESREGPFCQRRRATVMSSPKREVSTAGDHATRTYPINSQRLTAETLRWIAKELGLPTNASKAETRQMIEGRLAEEHEPKNVLVDVIESAPDERTIKLREGHSGSDGKRGGWRGTGT